MKKYSLRVPDPNETRTTLPDKPTPFTDESPMPFGIHMGKPMKKVPAQYLLWLWDSGHHENKGQKMHEYIKSVWNALLKECPDYCPENPPPRE